MKTKSKLIQAVRTIPSVAEKERWIFTFDKDEGTLFYSPRKIADNAELYQVTDEFAVYLDENYRPKGIMVEYFDANFIKHHDKLFEELSLEIFREDGETVATDDKSEKVRILRALFETTLIKEADMRLISA